MKKIFKEREKKFEKQILMMKEEQSKHLLKNNNEKIYLENIKTLIEKHFKGKSIGYIDYNLINFYQINIMKIFFHYQRNLI